MLSKQRTPRIVMALAALAILACDGGPTSSPDESARRVAPSADARFDLADDSVENAIALLLASQNPIADKPHRPFGGHRDKAVSLLERARAEIAKAQAYADDPKNQELAGP